MNQYFYIINEDSGKMLLLLFNELARVRDSPGQRKWLGEGSVSASALSRSPRVSVALPTEEFLQRNWTEAEI